MSASTASLVSILERARAEGFLGPGPVETHIHHADGFATTAESALGHTPREFADLGTGGGVPGLSLALRWPDARAIFVDSARRRCAFLRDALVELGLDDRVEMVEERGEAVGHPGPYRERFELVTARSFAEPAVTAEIAAGLVQVGGVLVVSEPPESDGARWPLDSLAPLGFGAVGLVEHAEAHFAVLSKMSAVLERFPRGVGKPAKRPLW